MHKKTQLITIGLILGTIFCLIDDVISYSETASIDEEIGIQIISWPFFLIKILVYSAIGAFVGFIIGLILSKIRK